MFCLKAKVNLLKLAVKSIYPGSRGTGHVITGATTQPTCWAEEHDVKSRSGKYKLSYNICRWGASSFIVLQYPG